MDDRALEMKDGLEFVLQQGVMIALLPVEKWLRDLEKVDAVGPMLDPTAYREYIQSGRDEVTKDLLRAAVGLKAAILRTQDAVKSGKVR